MTILLIGLDHHTAPVEVRERLAFGRAELDVALRQLRRSGLQEAAILSTCNRVEVYAVGDDAELTGENIVQFLSGFHGLERSVFEPYLYRCVDGEVARHLCATAAGARSLVVGEAQIQGQVREAAALAKASESSGPVLDRLFQTALVAGKRARSETEIGRSAASVSHVGVELARQLLGDLRSVDVLLVGSGKMSELAARNLLANGARSIKLVNRNHERAQALAAAWGGTAMPFEMLPEALSQADVVISSTAAPHTVIQAEHVRAALDDRSGRPLILIDLAVPRDVDSDVATLPGAHLYNIDDLQGVVGTNLDRRAAELSVVRAISEEEAAGFESWLAARSVTPTLEELRSRADAIRQSELEKALRRLGPLSEREQRVIETLAAGIVNKLLHEPMVRLRRQAEAGNGHEYADALRYLFGLDKELE